MEKKVPVEGHTEEGEELWGTGEESLLERGGEGFLRGEGDTWGGEGAEEGMWGGEGTGEVP